MNKRIVIRCCICGKELDFASNSIGRVEPKRVVQFGKTYNSKTEVDFICKECDKLITPPQERKRFPYLIGNARDLPKFT